MWCDIIYDQLNKSCNGALSAALAAYRKYLAFVDKTSIVGGAEKVYTPEWFRILDRIKAITPNIERKSTNPLSYKSEYVGKLEIDDVFCEVRYTIYHIEKCIYMDISVNTKTTAQAVKSLEHIQNQVFSAATQKNYIPIISYDAVSEYFCNKTFPLLNSLERNL